MHIHRSLTWSCEQSEQSASFAGVLLGDSAVASPGVLNVEVASPGVLNVEVLNVEVSGKGAKGY